MDWRPSNQGAAHSPGAPAQPRNILHNAHTNPIHNYNFLTVLAKTLPSPKDQGRKHGCHVSHVIMTSVHVPLHPSSPPHSLTSLPL